MGSVIIPRSSINGVLPSTEFKFFERAWANTETGRNFVQSVEKQFSEFGRVRGFRVNFDRINGFKDYPDLVKKTFDHLRTKPKGVQRTFLSEIRRIVATRGGKTSWSRSHFNLHRLWHQSATSLAESSEQVVATVAVVGAASTTTTTVVTTTAVSGASIAAILPSLFIIG